MRTGVCTDVVRFDLVQATCDAVHAGVATRPKASDNARFPLLVFGVERIGRVGMKAA